MWNNVMEGEVVVVAERMDNKKGSSTVGTLENVDLKFHFKL